MALAAYYAARRAILHPGTAQTAADRRMIVGAEAEEELPAGREAISALIRQIN